MSNELKRRLSVAEAKAQRWKDGLDTANEVIAALTKKLEEAEAQKCGCKDCTCA